MRISMILLFLLLMTLTNSGQPNSTGAHPINPIGHHFTNGSEKPFFWLGDTQWELFHQLSVKDASQLLLERKKQGFTVIQCMTTGVFPEWGQLKNLKPDSSHEAWLNRDPAQPNEDYFKRMDSIIDYAETIQMMLVIGVYHAQDVDHNRITSTNAKPWAKWLTARYRHAANIIWSMYPHADSASKYILNEVIAGITEGDGGNHLVTVHPDPSPKSSSFFSPADWLAFNTLQTWHSGTINYSMVLDDYYSLPARPVVNGEARYEDEDGTTPFETRRAAYFSYLAGGYYSFGHQNNWRSAITWRSWINSPGARQMTVLKNIFAQFSWWNLMPDSTILVNAHKENVAARSVNGEWMIVYLSHPEKITIGKTYDQLIRQSTAIWINPETGKKQAARLEISDAGSVYAPPKWTDAVLFIQKKT